MVVVSDEFHRRWGSGRHVGGAKPVTVVRVRRGIFDRGYTDWHGSKVEAAIPGETVSKPWQASWRATSDWKEIPGITEVKVEQAFDSNGIAQSIVTLKNTLLTPQNNMGQIYHLIDKGALAPMRGYNAPGFPNWPMNANEWFMLLERNGQIWVQQGYGMDTLENVYTGLIDDVDPASPDLLTLTTRDFGRVLTDERLFGWVDGPKVIDPVIFTAKKPYKRGPSDPVGDDAKASSTREGHPARFVTVVDKKSAWISHDHSEGSLTEWVQVRLPKGKYESFHIHPGYPGMEVYVGIFARDGLLGGESCEVDGMNIPNGWVNIPADEGGGIVPGGEGGWPYIKKWAKMSDKKTSYDLDHKLELGNDSVLRVGFRNLYHIGNGKHRASCIRLAGNRQKSERNIILKLVAKEPSASSSREGYGPSNVIDESTSTPWISDDHTAPNVTEWVGIRVPQGRYDSFQIHTDYEGMDMYVGVYARNRRRKKAKGKGYEYYPCQVNDVDEEMGEHWIRPRDLNGDLYPLVPGTHGNWPYIRYFPNVDAQPKGKPEKFSFGMKLELGDDSVIRIGFRGLKKIGPEKYRASVNKFKALTRSGVKQPDPPPPEVQKIEVSDPSDIVRVVLRWAGFKEWEIENTGAKLKGDWVFNRQTYLMDVIKKVAEATGFVFYMKGPSDADNSIGVPVFRSTYLLRDDLPDVTAVKDTEMLTGVQAKLSVEPLGYIIRVRGAANAAGKSLGSDKEKRLMSVYRPPWHPRMAGIIKHVVHEMARLEDQTSVEVAARLIAVQQALASATANIETSGHPGFELDDQCSMYDTGTGMKTRLYIARTSSIFINGRNASWKTVIGGALLDTPDMVQVKHDLFSLVPQSNGVPVIGDDVETS